MPQKLSRLKLPEHAEGRLLRRGMKSAAHRFGLPGVMNIDQRSLFTSFIWVGRLKRAKIKISMNGKASGRSPDTLTISSSNIFCAPSSMNASICTLGRPDRRPSLVSGAGSASTTIAATCCHGGQSPAVVCFKHTKADQLGAGRNLNQPEICPILGEYLTP
jgi:putative transposase